jgi:hypothetical protein
MQVDATHQGNSNKPKEAKKDHGSYIKHMQGKCYRCGSTDHTKKDSNNEHDMCNHCGKIGHRLPMCFTKYIRKPVKGAKAAATSDGSTSTSKPPSSSTNTKASASTSTPTKNNTTQADLLAELMKCIKVQDAQIKALEASFQIRD